MERDIYASREEFLSTPSARRATSRFLRGWQSRCISIHALREEGDVSEAVRTDSPPLFLSTPSARRATHFQRLANLFNFISIHALREEGDLCSALLMDAAEVISIHALREEGDGRWWTAKPCCSISIHALREEGDQGPARWFEALSYFYPRPPRGGRRIPGATPADGRQFLSTPSARRATHPSPNFRPNNIISIHALREEGDSKNRDKISIFL